MTAAEYSSARLAHEVFHVHPIVNSGCKLEPSESHALAGLDVEVDEKL